jgi:hypothetical protein
MNVLMNLSRLCLRALLDHFAKIKYARQARSVMYPLREVLFLVSGGTIASGDDYDESIERSAPRLAARLCRIPLRHSPRQLASRPGPIRRVANSE